MEELLFLAAPVSPALITTVSFSVAFISIYMVSFVLRTMCLSYCLNSVEWTENREQRSEALRRLSNY